MYGNYMYGIIVWKSLFDHVWVRKTLTHNKGVFGWFKFNFEGCFVLVLVWNSHFR